MEMKGLILLDWDNTLVDASYTFNDQRLSKALQEKIEQGWCIGLNSDTPLRRLSMWWQMLGLNGPIIAERGAVVWWPRGQELVLSTSQAVFADLLRQIMVRLSQEPDYAVFVGDSTGLITSTLEFTGCDSTLVALDAYRQCSIGLFVRVLRGGVLQTDISVLKHVHKLIESAGPRSPVVSQFVVNEDLAFISASALDVDKTAGLRSLISMWRHPTEIVMIGDSMADYLSLPGVRHFAVQNAGSEYKELSERIASSSYAAGCVELLVGL